MDDTDQGTVSELTDLDRVPLGDLRVTTDEALGRMLRRVVPDASAQRLPVAAFNSSL